MGIAKANKFPVVEGDLSTYFEELFCNSCFIVFFVDRDGYLRFVNPKAFSVLGLKDKDIDHCNVVNTYIQLSNINHKLWSMLENVIKTGKPELLTDKKVPTFLGSLTPVLRGRSIIGALCIALSRREFERLAESSDKYNDTINELNAIIENSYDGIFVADGNAVTLRVNSAFGKITGINPSELIGKTVPQLLEEGYFNTSVTLKVLETGKTETLINKAVKTGKEILVTGTPLFSKDGKINKVIINARDMTDLNNLNNQLQEAMEENKWYKKELQILQNLTDSDLVMASESMRNVDKLIEHASRTETNVLIQGETGVGKNMVAKEIHRKSSRSKTGIFLQINCAALPDTLLESELFGYENGAFTGAKREGKAGFFELTDKGTLFLDEIEMMSDSLQAALLQVLDNHEVLRVGGTKPRKIDTRVICASNADLKTMVSKKTFRADLFYRINVLTLNIPPLRERPEDILLLAKKFLDFYNRKYNCRRYIKKEVFDVFLKYPWPGNVRELKNVIEQLIIVSSSDHIEVSDLPHEFHKVSRRSDASSNFALPGCSLKEYLRDIEISFIKKAVRKYGSARRAAPYLGVNPSTITRKLKEAD